MANEIKQLECLSQISSAIIVTPSYSLSSFGILKDPGTKQLTYTGNIESSAKADYATAAAAINRQKEINRILEERLRQQQASTEQLKAEIARLRQEIANLMELIEVLTQQINNFKNAA